MFRMSGTFRSRTYFIRILRTITLVLIMFLLILSSVLYVFSRSMALEMQQDASRKVLNQISYNIDNLNETVRSLMMTAFNDRDMTVLMNNQDIEVFELYNKLNKLDLFVSSNPFIQSIWIYNGFNGCYYSTALSAMVSCKELDSASNLLKPYIVQPATLTKLTLLPIGPSFSEAGKQELFAYFMYKNLDAYVPGSSVLMMSIKAKWLFDNIRTLNELGENSLGDLFIMDSAGKVYSPGENGQIWDDSIYNAIRSASSPSGYLMIGEGSEKQIVTYMTSKFNNWKVVSVQPHDKVFGKVNKLFTMMVIILGIFIILAFVVSSLATVRLYRPFGRLMSKIQGLHEEQMGLSPKDELSMMSSVYDRIVEKMNQLQADHSGNHEIWQSYRLRRLITDSAAVSEEEFAECLPTAASAAEGRQFIVAVLKLDDYETFRRTRSEREQKLCRFAVTNIAGELYGGHFPNVPVDMKSDHAAVLLMVPPGDAEAAYAELSRLTNLVMSTVDSYYNLSLTAAFSEPFNDIRNTAESYEQALAYSLYRMVFGKMSVITPSHIAFRQGGDAYEIPYEMEKKLVEAIRSGESTVVHTRMDAIFEYMAELSPDNVDYAILHLLIILQHTVREISSNKLKNVAVDLRAYNHRMLEQETLADVRRLMNDLLHEVTEQIQSAAKGKNEYLIEAVKEIVENNYADENLSLQYIASALRMSAAYLGRFYRNSEGQSVADYINEVRLTKAQDMLSAGNDSIVAIMKNVGFTNESNFFKHFKKKTGATPGEYRLKKANPLQ
ncbi:helix-turn-helix domain-containing protein [Paenibacillus sp. NPDC056579]|uniref:helix-turn-helix domain-containing protein n=1 Tax=Paenibacillus sp. NPDC056579 TaxID=3345871 RepID=UPI0036A99C00